VAWTSGKAADLGSLLSLLAGGTVPRDRGCWPANEDRSGARPGGAKAGRRCWPEADDLPRGDMSPADAMRKIARGRAGGLGGWF
jgi:hypothetical protein